MGQVHFSILTPQLLDPPPFESPFVPVIWFGRDAWLSNLTSLLSILSLESGHYWVSRNGLSLGVHFTLRCELTRLPERCELTKPSSDSVSLV